MSYWPAKYHKRLLYGEKIPRKAKLVILGRKISKRELRRKIAEFKPEQGEHFCPACGCSAVRSTGNMVEYPERYVEEYCLRCGTLVEISDNSPYIHILDVMHKEKCSYKEVLSFW